MSHNRSRKVDADVAAQTAYLTIPDVAKRKVSEKTIRRLIVDGQLPAVRFGRSLRIRPEDLSKADKPVKAYQPSRDFLADLGGDAA